MLYKFDWTLAHLFLFGEVCSGFEPKAIFGASSRPDVSWECCFSLVKLINRLQGKHLSLLKLSAQFMVRSASQGRCRLHVRVARPLSLRIMMDKSSRRDFQFSKVEIFIINSANLANWFVCMHGSYLNAETDPVMAGNYRQM